MSIDNEWANFILNTNNKGNMFIEFNINYPKIKNAEKLEELKNLLGEIFT